MQIPRKHLRRGLTRLEIYPDLTGLMYGEIKTTGPLARPPDYWRTVDCRNCLPDGLAAARSISELSYASAPPAGTPDGDQSGTRDDLRPQRPRAGHQHSG